MNHTQHRVKAIISMTLCMATGVFLKQVGAQEISPADHDDAVKIAVTTCATCHGYQGRSISPKFPNIAGQHAPYLVAQLKNFKSHTRGDPDAIGYMWGMADQLEDKMIEALAVYYSAKKLASGEQSDANIVARGKDIYEHGVASSGIPACSACHGPQAEGTDQFPRLAGQHAQYILKQLNSFQTNLRDVAIMHGVAASLKGNEMSAVAAYMQTLGP